jgi:type I restriction enzyme M protein
MLLETATLLMGKIGTDEYNDFNLFSAEKVDEVLKAEKIKLSASEKNPIYAP